ncbi:hypothetical protein HMPREF1869_01526 [Bacteroidales bacterium KA00251]|nr:hypothetical protein HMPREF1869_01526 [Bacteroidales bacterium KA00251]
MVFIKRRGIQNISQQPLQRSMPTMYLLQKRLQAGIRKIAFLSLFKST